MRISISRQLLLFTASMIAAFMLTIFPLPDWAIWLRPLWVLMVLAYWSLILPEWIGIGVAWCVGLLLDVLLGTLLGQHALALVIVTFLLLQFYPRIRVYSLAQKTVVIFFLSLIYSALLYWVQGLLGLAPATWEFWIPTVTTTLLWPLVFLMLKDLSRRQLLI